MAVKIGSMLFTHFIFYRFSKVILSILIISKLLNPANPVIAISTSLLGRAKPLAHDPYILVVTGYSKIKKYNLTNKKLLNYELYPFRNTISKFKHFIRLNI